MALITDEMISAFLDGEADRETSARIEAALAKDAELAARVERLSVGDAALRDASDLLLGDVPDALRASLTAPAEAEVIAIRRRRRPTQRRDESWMRLAAASVAALVIGAVGGAWLAPKGQPVVSGEGSGLALSGALAQAVSEARSGEAVRAGGQTVRVALSFRGGDGRLCRQFDVSGEAGAAAGVACRKDGGWNLEGWTRRLPAASGYELASGPGDPATEAVLQRLGAGDPLDAQEEAAAIFKGWSR